MSNRLVTFAAIGSRESTREAEMQMKSAVMALLGRPYARKYNYLTQNLREDVEFEGLSGGAQGMDSAAEDAAKLVGGRFKAYSPWVGYQNRTDMLQPSTWDNWPRALELCLKYHPAPDRLQGKTLSLLARDSYQVLNDDLDSPVDFVLCWTPDGKVSGGTGQAMRIANDYDIPIFNIHDHRWMRRLHKWLGRFRDSGF